MDEIYYAFIINDMMAKAATGQLSAEDAVKWPRSNARSS
jgi:multiple sugar transport system substrate-binding protein